MLFILISITSVQATLTDNDYVDTNPDGKPIHQSNNSFATSKIWTCKGTVDPDLRKMLFEKVTILSDAYDMQLPADICTFQILNIKSDNRTVYEIAFHISQEAMDKCIVNDVCIETRSVSLPMIKGKLHQSYFLISPTKGFAKACLTMNGNIISKTETCK